MTRFSARLTVTPELRALIGARGRTVSADVTSNLEYITRLEYGHSRGQAPNGMIRNFLPEYEGYLAEAVQHFVPLAYPDVERGMQLAIRDAALRIMRAIVERTPVKTGRAKGSWVARLPGGQEQRGAPEVPAGTKRKARSRRALARANGGS